jgi:hypothetical protein
MAYSTDDKRLEGYLRASALVPDGSPLNDVLDAFFEHTPVGLELPLFSFIYYVSAWLTQEDVGIMVGGKKIPPALWIVLLARSGGFKSFSSDIIKRNAPVQSNLDGFESEAKMIDLMADNRREEDDNGNPVIPQRHRWVCDEFAQTLKKIETEGGPLAGCKKYLLLALKEKHGDDMTIRDVVMGMSGYKVTASEARALWQIAFGSKPPAPRK